jgi:hypothetical protein
MKGARPGRDDCEPLRRLSNRPEPTLDAVFDQEVRDMGRTRLEVLEREVRLLA